LDGLFAVSTVQLTFLSFQCIVTVKDSTT